MKKQKKGIESENHKKLYLYVKTSPLGLKYLGKTVKNPYKYMGSGVVWKKHLKKHKFDQQDIKTEILFETYSVQELQDKGIYYSRLYNVVEEPSWANLREEQGDGGDTSKFINYRKRTENTDYSKMVENRDLVEIGKKISNTKKLRSKVSSYYKCDQCGNEFWRPNKNVNKHTKKFCSSKCSAEYRKGKKRPKHSLAMRGANNSNSKKFVEVDTGRSWNTVKDYLSYYRISYYKFTKKVENNQIKFI